MKEANFHLQFFFFFFFFLQTVFSLKNNASKFQFILSHETVFVQINICANNCIAVIARGDRRFSFVK